MGYKEVEEVTKVDLVLYVMIHVIALVIGAGIGVFLAVKLIEWQERRKWKKLEKQWYESRKW